MDGRRLYKHGLRAYSDFERQLTDNGYLVIKFFMQIDRAGADPTRTETASDQIRIQDGEYPNLTDGRIEHYKKSCEGI